MRETISTDDAGVEVQTEQAMEKVAADLSAGADVEIEAVGAR